MSLLALDTVSFSFGARTVLDGISLSVGQGEVAALLGPNGSGKTTLLRLMLGLLSPDAGTVTLGGTDLRRLHRPELARQMAYVPQAHRETFAYRVRDIVLMGRQPHRPFLGPAGAEDRRIVAEALERLGISHLAERSYTEISGGERQLALIARAMAQQARIVVMDEPTNGLDYGNQVRLLERIKALAREGNTFIFSTHHPDHALAVASRVVTMRHGGIVSDGPPGTLDEATLGIIYQVKVHLVPVVEGVRVCVPALHMEQ
ncbi:ABC transporter ATP-binding protein [Geomesophilobacter sediminis]|uniref:ABC transporter ATP-binding protein n=1 Tax=Geomesophilobacter sediminis TaxID=2798584 RepID=A0A8J7JCK4_9BACT|nr:ABC transporter ATP-binding protein [Geomesophilobacter sediminis]MBJ6725061.1 ABC transporter ATP-binding protein [Geomesophilobacter sediminis]